MPHYITHVNAFLICCRMPEFFPAPKDAQDLLLTKAASQFTGNRLPVSSVFESLLEITAMCIQNRNASNGVSNI